MQEYPIQEIVEALESPAYITIVSHRNPDGDAIGSSLAMKHMLQLQGHTVQVVLPSEFPHVFDWMSGADDIVIYDNDKEVAEQYMKRADWIVGLDFNSLDRIDKMGKLIVAEEKKVILIDHHLDPEPMAEIIMSDPSSSSTCELVFKLFQQAGWMFRMTKDIAESIFTGLSSDTGAFRFATSPDVYRIAAKLKEFGVDDKRIQEQIFDHLTEKQLRLLGHCLANRMEILHEYQTGIIGLSKDDYNEFDIQRGDTEGIVNYILKIPGIHVAAFIKEQPKITKMSLRSKGNISVQKIASENFNGGGHFNASGGYMFKPLDYVIKRFKSVLPNYIK